jgi:NAD(P)-dependent dehydrogenase (short-subunit alcohol dehydrogenase family)
LLTRTARGGPAGWLRGKRVLLTGASSGLGRELALCIGAKAGALLLVARRGRRLHSLVSQLVEVGATAEVACARVDLCRPSAVDRMHAIAVERFRGIDVVINCAAEFFCGIDLVDTSPEDFSRMLSVNLLAPYLICRKFIPMMRRRGVGRVLNIISATNRVSQFAAFRVSKIALEVATQALIEESASTGLGIAAVNPGWMRTEHSLSGADPRLIAEALTKLLGGPNRQFDSRFFDVVETRSGFEARARRRAAGLYGTTGRLLVPYPAAGR